MSEMTDEMRAAMIRLVQEQTPPGEAVAVHALGCAESRGAPCDCEPLVFVVGEAKA